MEEEEEEAATRPRDALVVACCMSMLIFRFSQILPKGQRKHTRLLHAESLLAAFFFFIRVWFVVYCLDFQSLLISFRRHTHHKICMFI